MIKRFNDMNDSERIQTIETARKFLQSEKDRIDSLVAAAKQRLDSIDASIAAAAPRIAKINQMESDIAAALARITALELP